MQQQTHASRTRTLGCQTAFTWDSNGEFGCRPYSNSSVWSGLYFIALMTILNSLCFCYLHGYRTLETLRSAAALAVSCRVREGRTQGINVFRGAAFGWKHSRIISRYSLHTKGTKYLEKNEKGFGFTQVHSWGHEENACGFMTIYVILQSQGACWSM